MSWDAQATRRRLSDCEVALAMVSAQKIAMEINAVPQVEFALPGFKWRPDELTFPTLPDGENPALLVLPHVDGQPDIPHEINTARDYAEFVHRQHGQRFIFISRFEGRSVPVFDGVVVHSNGAPSENISLKYTSRRVIEVELETLLKAVGGRLDLTWESRHLQRPIDFFRTANGYPLSEDNFIFARNFNEQIVWTARLAALFDLYRPHSVGFGREFRTVVDMRDSGFSFNFIRRPGNLRAINQLMRDRAQKNTSLTLLWNHQQVIEFKGGLSTVFQ